MKGVSVGNKWKKIADWIVVKSELRILTWSNFSDSPYYFLVVILTVIIWDRFWGYLPTFPLSLLVCLALATAFSILIDPENLLCLVTGR